MTSEQQKAADYGTLKFLLAGQFSDKSDGRMRDAIRALKELLLERQQQRAILKHQKIANAKGVTT